jgi:hypothetical protein
MKLIAAAACLVAMLIVPPLAQARISLAEVKRENREAVRRACFDHCIEWEVHFCKRVGADRAKCAGRVTWLDDYGVTNTCRVINRFRQKQGDAQIYKISKRCDASTTAG